MEYILYSLDTEINTNSQGLGYITIYALGCVHTLKLYGRNISFISMSVT